MPQTHYERQARPTVLVVDDLRFNQKTVSNYLRKKGFSVMTAANGRQAFREVMAGGIDAMVIDTQMPMMDGFSTAKAIRNFESGAEHMAIIGMGKHDGSEKALCLSSGMDACLPKPIKKDELISALNKALEETEQAQQDYLFGEEGVFASDVLDRTPDRSSHSSFKETLGELTADSPKQKNQEISDDHVLEDTKQEQIGDQKVAKKEVATKAQPSLNDDDLLEAELFQDDDLSEDELFAEKSKPGDDFQKIASQITVSTNQVYDQDQINKIFENEIFSETPSPVESTEQRDPIDEEQSTFQSQELLDGMQERESTVDEARHESTFDQETVTDDDIAYDQVNTDHERGFDSDSQYVDDHLLEETQVMETDTANETETPIAEPPPVETSEFPKTQTEKEMVSGDEAEGIQHHQEALNQEEDFQQPIHDPVMESYEDEDNSFERRSNVDHFLNHGGMTVMSDVSGDFTAEEHSPTEMIPINPPKENKEIVYSDELPTLHHNESSAQQEPPPAPVEENVVEQEIIEEEQSVTEEVVEQVSTQQPEPFHEEPPQVYEQSVKTEQHHVDTVEPLEAQIEEAHYRDGFNHVSSDVDHEIDLGEEEEHQPDQDDSLVESMQKVDTQISSLVEREQSEHGQTPELPSVDDISIESEVHPQGLVGVGQTLNKQRVPVFDLDKAMGIHEDDLDFFKENASEFVAAVGKTLPKLRGCLGAQDMQTMSDMARKIVGAGSYLAAEEVISLARRIHKLSSEGETELLAEHIENLEKSLARFKREVDKL